MTHGHTQLVQFPQKPAKGRKYLHGKALAINKELRTVERKGGFLVIYVPGERSGGTS